VAISGGAKAALLALPDLPGIEGLVLINGIANNLESMFYSQIIYNGLRAKKGDDEVQQEILQQKGIFDGIKSNCSAEVVSWTDRSNLFWCQLIADSEPLRPTNWPKGIRYLVIDGDEDVMVPMQVGVERYSELLASGHDAELKLFPGMGHNFYQFMGAAFERILSWSK
jgi:pimeloyl-ACP methyl ester carboxylesterase